MNPRWADIGPSAGVTTGQIRPQNVCD